MVAQVWARDGLGCMADVGGDGLFRRAEVGDEHNPKRRCGRIGVSRTKLPCAAHTRHVHETCPPSGRKANSAPRDYSAAGVSTQQTRHSVRRRSAREGCHGGLRPAAAVSGAEAAAAADCVGFIAAATA